MTTLRLLKVSGLARTNSGPLLATRGDRAQLMIYGSIGEVFGGIGPAQVSEALNGVKAKQLDVFLSSDGGSANDGVAIYNVLGRFPANKTIYVDGVAASAASLILMAGDERVAMPGSRVMVHGPWNGVIGNAADMRAAADKLDQLSASIAEIYARRTGQSAERVAEWLASSETWFDAQQAMDSGLVDRVAEPPCTDEPKKESTMATYSPIELMRLRAQAR
jgi:ATP-dependent Clp endopeptidase proteolytic subunit ClpP